MQEDISLDNSIMYYVGSIILCIMRPHDTLLYMVNPADRTGRRGSRCDIASDVWGAKHPYRY